MAQTPKEKAEELINKMYNTEHCGIEHFPNKNYCECIEMNMFQAKQCALKAVDEILNNDGFTKFDDYLTEYWKEVKQEIEKK